MEAESGALKKTENTSDGYFLLSSCFRAAAKMRHGFGSDVFSSDVVLEDKLSVSVLGLGLQTKILAGLGLGIESLRTLLTFSSMIADQSILHF